MDVVGGVAAAFYDFGATIGGVNGDCEAFVFENIFEGVDEIDVTCLTTTVAEDKIGEAI